MTSPATFLTTARRPSWRRRRIAALSAATLLGALLVVPATGAAAAIAAPGAPGTPSTWAEGDHNGFGTARGTASKVWYTLRGGELTDVYYPGIDTPSIRDSQFVVTGAGFTDREDRDAVSKVELVDSRSLVYRLTTTAKSGKWRIVKTFVTDPARSTVLQRVQFTSLTGAATSSTCCTPRR
jgi:glucoamylase